MANPTFNCHICSHITDRLEERIYYQSFGAVGNRNRGFRYQLCVKCFNDKNNCKSGLAFPSYVYCDNPIPKNTSDTPNINLMS